MLTPPVFPISIIRDILRFSYKYKPLYIGLKCQSLKLACMEVPYSSYLMVHNKLPKTNGIEHTFIILTDSGSGFQTGHSGDGLSQFHDVWGPA